MRSRSRPRTWFARTIGSASRRPGSGHHILKFLVRRGRIYCEGSHWTGKHTRWLQKQRFDTWRDTTSFEELVSGLRELEDRRRRLGKSLERLAQEEARAIDVAVLRCFYGIDTAQALALVTEIFDVEVAKQYRHRPGVDLKLKRRREGQPLWAIEIADRAHQRLHRRYWTLLQCGMPAATVTTAIAPELSRGLSGRR